MFDLLNQDQLKRYSYVALFSFPRRQIPQKAKFGYQYIFLTIVYYNSDKKIILNFCYTERPLLT